MFSILFRRVQLMRTSLNDQIICNYMKINQFSSQKGASAVRRKKAKSQSTNSQHFVDLKQVRAIGGRGGDGCISFLHLWSNENGGPDGGDGGNGGHVVFEAKTSVNNLAHLRSLLQATNGENGQTKDCSGKCAPHLMVPVPVGTIVRNINGKVVGDLDKVGMMFVAARGGAGGKGNHFFVSSEEQTPEISEYGATGEDVSYLTELRSMAHLGLIGLPNAGKSTLLQAITRARPKVAPYAFTTLQPHLGMVHYDDYEQISIADLPGLIPGSHKNRGLGIQFLKHAERCAALLFIIDVSCDEPWKHFETLKFELSQFSPELVNRPQIIVANKIDLPEAKENLKKLKEMYDIPMVPISAKIGTNLSTLLIDIRKLYDEHCIRKDDETHENENI